MPYHVMLTKNAEADLEDIYDYIVENDSSEKADYVLDQLLKTADSLANFPEKGNYPKELQELGIRDFRQTFFKPYRVIYQITGKQVVIFVIADGRRDMQTLLTHRLLSVSA
ncbi:RelE/ParE family toxin [Photorhabdus luminescens]|uniref:Type II toxin-antitoxin system RelE/ParE family toxin n=3 Tax=Photorhabdus TaxID=29487 RepID=A0A0A0CQD8_9GAMM|nr:MULTISPECIES: type II toxin-antitoxin system RelE/ParE family toxin [Photorhabdus]KGM27960.1 plasmid stabilization protein [Photorhabdus luminescens]MBS9428117.1 type II toxin-antitoxin system RelE/ParE family toxin [Photorhabdus akhurstii]MBS9431455.1 type II toxin-antitoxin system RelE/ParE family toxin [Photorhabdus hainanensis]MCC8457882.1 type II toxin-antitoxin system RelE/ParE family toxin [Photorhabdus aegyptia]OCA52481.1 Toxin ParE3 [Photorhabdus namnaonensis]